MGKSIVYLFTRLPFLDHTQFCFHVMGWRVSIFKVTNSISWFILLYRKMSHLLSCHGYLWPSLWFQFSFFNLAGSWYHNQNGEASRELTVSFLNYQTSNHPMYIRLKLVSQWRFLGWQPLIFLIEESYRCSFATYRCRAKCFVSVRHLAYQYHILIITRLGPRLNDSWLQHTVSPSIKYWIS